MSIRRAIILISLIFLAVIALLSVAAYTVARQDAKNTLAVATAPQAIVLTAPVRPATASTPVPVSNDAINTDITPIQYKTVVGQGYRFEAPIDWNSFQENIGNCTAESVTDGKNNKIDIWPDTCAVTGLQYGSVTHVQGYSIATNDSDLVAYQHVLSSFQLLKQ